MLFTATVPKSVAQLELELEHERRRLKRLVTESAEMLAIHDLRRKGLEGTHATYQRLLAEANDKLNSPT